MLDFAYNGATGHVRGCTGTMINSKVLRLTCTQLLFVRNDTVPISVLRSGSMRSTEGPRDITAVTFRRDVNAAKFSVLHYLLLFKLQVHLGHTDRLTGY